MAESRTYWRIETQSEGVRDFYNLRDACNYSYNAPLILRIEERLGWRPNRLSAPQAD